MSLTEAQQIYRLSGVGASEVAAVAGISPYQSPFDIWCVKKGLVDHKETLPMRFGTFNEPLVLALYAERTGDTVIPAAVYWPDSVNGTLRHPAVPSALCTPDGVVPPRKTLVQAKTASIRVEHHWGEDGSEDVPDYYRAQIEQEMAVAGFERCDVAVLLGNEDHRIYPIERNPTLGDALLEIGARFWRDYIVADVPPPITASRDTGDYLRERHPADRLPLRAWTEEALALTELLASAKRLRKQAEQEEVVLINQLKALIGDATGFGAGDRRQITWKCDSRGKPQWREIALALSASPELIEQYAGVPNRVLRLAGFGVTDE
jgi:putative phage-type endonuclease